MHTSVTIVFGQRELLKTSETLPPILNMDFEAVVEIRIGNESLIILERRMNVNSFNFHHVNMS